MTNGVVQQSPSQAKCFDSSLGLDASVTEP